MPLFSRIPPVLSIKHMSEESKQDFNVLKFIAAPCPRLAGFFESFPTCRAFENLVPGSLMGMARSPSHKM
jgi:hypothetical protein